MNATRSCSTFVNDQMIDELKPINLLPNCVQSVEKLLLCLNDSIDFTSAIECFERYDSCLMSGFTIFSALIYVI